MPRPKARQQANSQAKRRAKLADLKAAEQEGLLQNLLACFRQPGNLPAKLIMGWRLAALLVLALFFLYYTSLTCGHAPAEGRWSAPAWLYLSTQALCVWTALLVFLLPDLASSAIEAVSSVDGTPRRIAVGLTLAAVLVGYSGYKASHSPWNAPKEFDDVMAISNASVLTDNGFDTQLLFFRSRQRIGFTAFAAPLTAASPLALETVTRSPSDNNRRIWHIYKDPGSDSGKYFPLISMTALLLGFLMPAMQFRILQRLRFPLLPALFSAALVTTFWYRSIEVYITQTFTLFIVMLAAQAYLAVAEQKKSVPHALGLGLLFGFAGLTMNTTVIIAFAAMAFQAFHFWQNRSWSYLAKCALMWGVAGLSVLLWYEGFLTGFLEENHQLNVEVQETQQLMHYEPLSLHSFMGIVRSMCQNWWVASLAGLLVIVARRLRVAGAALMLPWFFFSLVFIPTMPFVFKRFVMYSIPPAAYLVAVLLLGAYWALRRIFPRTRQASAQEASPCPAADKVHA